MDEDYPIVNTLLYEVMNGQYQLKLLLMKIRKQCGILKKTMADLFKVSKSTISEHLKHIFEEGELNKNSTVRKIQTVQMEGIREVKR